MRIKTLLTTAGLSAAALAVGVPGVAAAAPAPGDVVVSEVRFRGPAGAADEYIELTNRTNTPQNLTGSVICAAQSGGVNSNLIATPTATIPPNSAYIYRNSGASSLNVGQSDAPFTGGITDDRGVGLFTGTAVTACTAANRIDSFAITFAGTANAIYTEGTAEAPLTNAAPPSQLAYVRRYASGKPIDTNNNASDFVLVAAQTATINGVQPIFGTPGLQRDPVRPQSGGLAVTRVNTAVPVGSSPNRTFDGTTLRLRRRITNNTGAAVSNAKLRVVDITTSGAQTAGQVDLRLVTSTSGSPTYVDTALDTDAFTATVPTQGGLNSAVKIGTVPAGGSVDVQIQFTVLGFSPTDAKSFSVMLIPEGGTIPVI